MASTSYMCGAQNCRWILYKYDIKNELLEVVDNDIFGSADLYPNYNFNKIAILRYVHRGYCNSGGYIDIIDLSNFEKSEIDGLKKSYNVSYINSFRWKDVNKLEFEIFYSDCGIDPKKENLTETLEYDAKKDILTKLQP